MPDTIREGMVLWNLIRIRRFIRKMELGTECHEQNTEHDNRKRREEPNQPFRFYLQRKTLENWNRPTIDNDAILTSILNSWRASIENVSHLLKQDRRL